MSHSFDGVTGELATLSTAVSSSPLLLTLIGGFVGLVGAFVGGAITAWATAAGVRRSLEAQFELQGREWERRDRERDQERRDREETEKGKRESSGTAAVQALAIEALWNSTLLLIAANEVRASRHATTPRIRISREQFDRHFLVAMERLQGAYMQQIASAYLAGFGLQRSRESAENSGVISADDLKAVDGVSESFLIVFRSLGNSVFSRQSLEELEMTRRIYQARQMREPA